MKEPILKSSTPSSTRTAGSPGKKGSPAGRKALLFLALFLITFLAGGYLLSTRSGSPNHEDEKVRFADGIIKEKQIIAEDKSIVPAITKAKLHVEYDRIKVLIEEDQNDKKTIKYKYEWIRNGKPMGVDGDSITAFQKGDKIAVRVTPFDHEKGGQSVLLSMNIAQAPPRVIENKTVSFDGNVLSHQVKAVDPDGGKVSYALIDAPKNMTIDSSTGLINWHVQPSEHGRFNVSVLVKNDNGAEVLYPLRIDIDKRNE